MTVTALIAEYNPFHSGHQYHMDMARKLTGADALLVVMSGDFVQRGLPALVDKQARTRMALAAGADAVIELPVRTATSSAEGFADGAIRLLDALGCVTDLVYGCEAETAESLAAVAALLAGEPEAYRLRLREGLRRGLGYPQARSEAAESLLPGSATLLSSPNNILAVEYQKALLRRGSQIRPHGLKRLGLGYHQSATQIRRACEEGSLEGMAGYLPDFCRRELARPLFADDFSQLLQFRLLTLSEEEVSRHHEVSPELAARLVRRNRPHYSFSELVTALACKNQTTSHLQRALIHLLLGLQKEEPPLVAARFLGFHRESPLLKELKSSAHLPLVSKLADAPPSAFGEELHAARIYQLAYGQRYGLPLPDEYRSLTILSRPSV